MHNATCGLSPRAVACRSLRHAGLVCVAALVLVVAACSSGPANSGSQAGSGKDSGAGTSPSLQARDSAHLPSDWASIVAAANKEGKVIVYTNFPDSQTAPIVAAFNKIYPKIKIEAVTDSSASLPTRYEQERTSTGKSPADLLLSGLFESLISAHPTWFNNLLTLPPNYFPSLEDYSKQAVPADRPHSVTEAAYVWQLAYNKNKVKQADLPKSWADVSDRKWKSKGIIVDPRSASAYGVFYSLILKTNGASSFAGIGANNFTLSQSTADIVTKVAAGAYDIGFPANASKAAPLIAAGAPLGLVSLQPYALGATTMSAPTDAPDPDAQRVFGNFLLSAQAQEIQCQVAHLGSLNQLAKGACSQYVIPSDAVPLSFSISSADEAAVEQGLNLK